MARITFLGTAGSTAVTSKQLRSSGGIIIQAEDLQFHLDPGPGALNKAKEYNINLLHTNAILVSHNHINHCNDLNVLIDAMTHGGIEQRGVLLTSKSILHPTDESHPFLTRHHQRMIEKIILMEKDHKVAIEIVEIHALPAQHTDPHAVGFKIFCPKLAISYSGDTIATPQLIESMTGSDVLILNVPYPDDKATGQNLDTFSAQKIVAAVKPKIAILTHFGMEMLKADPIMQAREIQRATGVQTIAAHDGLAVAPGGYELFSSPVKGY